MENTIKLNDIITACNVAECPHIRMHRNFSVYFAPFMNVLFYMCRDSYLPHPLEAVIHQCFYDSTLYTITT
jgi:hypothetical protein